MNGSVGNAITGTIHCARSTPFLDCAAWRLRQVIRSQVLPSILPHVNVTCLFTNPHALWGLMRVNSTPPIQELGFRHKAFPLSIDFATSATRATKYTCTCCSLFFLPFHLILHLAHWGPTCTDLLKYNLLESPVAASCNTLGSLLSRDSYTAFPSSQTFLQLISRFKPAFARGLFTLDPLTSGFQALTASKPQ